ncbi:MAG: 4-(cytidine 5'-diphospho)-2-C-methyl-D-erythritol kinase [Hyphomicrobiales bacterium]
MICETAFAKINLWLTVLGRRTDGYHDIDSLAVFTELGDRLTARPAPEWGLDITGPHAGQLGRLSDNLVLRAAIAFAERFGGDPMHFSLQKNLPVAAGLGGGSADAAAALRILARHNRLSDSAGAAAALPELLELAGSLGADIPVCLGARCAHMTGTGVTTTMVTIGSGAVLLINPGIHLATGEVFAGLGLQPGQRCAAGAAPPSPPTPPDGWLERALQAGNDLQSPASALVPEIGEIVRWITATEHCQLARMSGSGATCFGIYPSLGAARAAQAQARKRFPHWWVAASKLRG